MNTKYRPKIWMDVVGQPHVVNILSRQVINGKIKQAYLFCGPSGVSKTTCARILANELNGCEGGVIELDAASNSSIESVRELVASTQTLSLTTKYKVLVIDECHQLKRPAWDVLLKTIEEPPKHCIFIFCPTNPTKVPETILSRVQRFDFRRVSDADIVGRLAFICNDISYNYDERALYLIAKHADGNVRTAIQLLDTCVSSNTPLTVEGVETLFGYVKTCDVNDLINAILTNSRTSALAVFNRIMEYATNYKNVFDDLINYTSDYLITDISGDVAKRNRYLMFLNRLVYYRKFALEDNSYKTLIQLVVEEQFALNRGGTN